MNYRTLGRSGLKVPELCFGTGTFGGANDFFKSWGSTQDKEAAHLIDICMEAGCNFFDTADIYSDGHSESVLGKAIAHLPRTDVLLSTKATFRGSNLGPNNVGSSRYHLIQALDNSLKRLNTDYVDVYHLHAFDATTPLDETLSTLDNFIREGKVRYIACSNFSGWHLMKSLSLSERTAGPATSATRSTTPSSAATTSGSSCPWPLDQGVGALVWSPLGWGRLTGKIRRGQPLPETSRLQNQSVIDAGPTPRLGTRLQSSRRPRCPRRRNRQDRPATSPQLAPPAPHHQHPHHRSPRRKTTPRQPSLHRLEPHPRTSSQTRRRQRPPARLPLLAPGPVRRTQSLPHQTNPRLIAQQLLVHGVSVPFWLILTR